MNKLKLEKLNIESLLKKKSNYLKISISFIVLGVGVFILGMLAIRKPSLLGENPPSRTFFRTIFVFCFTFSAIFLSYWNSIKKEIKRRNRK